MAACRLNLEVSEASVSTELPRRLRRLAHEEARSGGTTSPHTQGGKVAPRRAAGPAALTGRAMSVPFTRGSGGRQGARAVNTKRADLGDLPSVLVGLVLGVALQARGRVFDDTMRPKASGVGAVLVVIRARAQRKDPTTLLQAKPPHSNAPCAMPSPKPHWKDPNQIRVGTEAPLLKFCASVVGTDHRVGVDPGSCPK